MQPLMQKVMTAAATDDERRKFGELWQERVEKILIEHAKDARLIRIQEL
jgi:hypothetical protein